MKIKWVDGERIIPGLGLFVSGQVRDVPADLGRALINQKQAVSVKDDKPAEQVKEEN